MDQDETHVHVETLHTATNILRMLVAEYAGASANVVKLLQESSTFAPRSYEATVLVDSAIRLSSVSLAVAVSVSESLQAGTDRNEVKRAVLEQAAHVLSGIDSALQNASD